MKSGAVTKQCGRAGQGRREEWLQRVVTRCAQSYPVYVETEFRLRAHATVMGCEYPLLDRAVHFRHVALTDYTVRFPAPHRFYGSDELKGPCHERKPRILAFDHNWPDASHHNRHCPARLDRLGGSVRLVFLLPLTPFNG